MSRQANAVAVPSYTVTCSACAYVTHGRREPIRCPRCDAYLETVSGHDSDPGSEEDDVMNERETVVVRNDVRYPEAATTMARPATRVALVEKVEDALGVGRGELAGVRVDREAGVARIDEVKR